MANGFESARIELIGVSLVGPPPIGEVHIRLTPGLSALYGLNGAGKTAVLSGIERAFTGYADPAGSAYLHIRIPPGSADAPHDYLDSATRHVREFSQMLDAGPKRGGLSDEATLSVDMTLDYWRESQNDLFVPPMTPAQNAELAAAYATANWKNARTIARQGFFTLVARGTGSPSWDVFVAFRPSETPPLVYIEGLPEEGQPPPPTLPVPIAVRWSDTVASWVPSALVLAGHLQDPDVLPQVVTHQLGGAESPSEIIGGLIAGADAPPLIANAGTVLINPDVESLLVALSARASEISAKLLEDAPVLRCELKEPRDWLRGPPGEWQAYDSPTGEWVSPAQLSEAQRRWALMSIWTTMLETGVQLDDSHIGCLVIDEPEAALHPSAQRYAVSGLKALAEELACPIVVATHSPALLDDPDIVLRHVFRGPMGRTAILELTDPMRQALEGLLGMTPSNALQIVRTFLLVEGEHDIVVLKRVMGEELERARVHMLPLRGAGGAVRTLADPQLIFDCTDARVMVCLDHIKFEDLDRAWSEARVLTRTGDLGGARETLRAMKKGMTPSKEERLLRELGERAIDRGTFDRIELFGFKEADIIMYLDYGDLVPSSGDWKTASKEWRSLRYQGERRGFKDWLEDEKGATINQVTIEKAAGRLDGIPVEFTSLLEKLEPRVRR
jgi:hypothetical protein